MRFSRLEKRLLPMREFLVPDVETFIVTIQDEISPTPEGLSDY